MKVILDSNILFSALISPHGSPHLIYRAWRQHRFTLITASYQLNEIRRASRYPHFQHLFKPAQVGTMINNLQNANIFSRLKITPEFNDPNDDFLYALAQVSSADYLVTGDRKSGLLQQKNIGNCCVVTAQQFCQALHLKLTKPIHVLTR
jgi:putative PIN family toxin of toxin-antitoxin system